jgi:hypothetical protein
MPIIATGKSLLQETIKQAFILAKEDGSTDGANPDKIINDLSSNIADAVHNYVTSITVVINPGIPVSTAGSPTAQVGSTTGPGSS